MPTPNLLLSNHYLVRAGYLLAVASALFFLGRNAWPDPDYYPVDFKYFWLSGKLWLEGASPYSPALQTLGGELFPGERINPFFYPPGWRLLTAGLAAMPPDVSESVWAALSAVAIAGSAWLCALIANILYPDGLSRMRIFVLVFGAVCIGAHAVEISIQIGQPAPFLLLAFCALLYSALRPNAIVSGAALTILLLKPQLGAPVALACIFAPSMRPGLVIAAAVSAALTIYGLGLAPIETLKSFLANISLYGSFPENAALMTSGPVFLFGLAGANPVNAFVMLGLSAAMFAAAGVYITKDAAPLKREPALRFIFFATAVTLFLMPTHNFDFLVLAPLLVLMWARGRWIAWTAAIGLFLTMRAMSLSLLTHGFLFADKTVNVSFFDTLGSLAIAVAAGALLFSEARSTAFVVKPKLTPMAGRRPA